MSLARTLRRPFLMLLFACACWPTTSFAQETAADPAAAEKQAEQGHDRIWGIIPNYRTSPTLTDYLPLTTKEKFTVAAQDSFDRGTFVLAALFAAEAQLKNSTPAFGSGVHAYARYYPAALTDFIVGDFMTEAIYPALLRQDPRYFRRGTGSGWRRLGYALGQIVWTHTDAGGSQFNFSEFFGNATAVGISNAYYPGSRTVSGDVTKLSVQIGVDAASNVLKEFAPDLDRFFSRRRTPEPHQP